MAGLIERVRGSGAARYANNVRLRLARAVTPDPRYPWRPWWARVRRESDVHPHTPAERGELFEAFNAGSTEFEVLNWLHATVRVLKPDRVIETGAHDGLGTIALASACKMNGFGIVHSVEIDPDKCRALARRVAEAGLSAHVAVECQDSLGFLRQTELVFDIGFYDSLCRIRAEEFELCLDRRIVRSVGVFHDTSPDRCVTMADWPDNMSHDDYRAHLARLTADPRCCGSFESRLSRGFTAIFVRPVGP